MSWAEDNGIDIYDEEIDDQIVDDKIYFALDRIVKCEKSEFKDMNHMINYMKKIARITLDECFYDED